MARKTQQDWLDAGLKMLADDGATALNIDRLAAALGVTKGSFYHHFPHFQAYKDSLLALIEDVGFHQVLLHVDQGGTPAEKLRRLFTYVYPYPLGIENSLRAWATQDAEVEALQRRLDTQRVEYVAAQYRQLMPDAKQADAMAKMVYALFIGMQSLIKSIPDMPQDTFEQFMRMYLME